MIKREVGSKEILMIWESELAVKGKSIYTVLSGMERCLYWKGTVGGLETG